MSIHNCTDLPDKLEMLDESGTGPLSYVYLMLSHNKGGCS